MAAQRPWQPDLQATYTPARPAVEPRPATLNAIFTWIAASRRCSRPPIDTVLAQIAIRRAGIAPRRATIRRAASVRVILLGAAAIVSDARPFVRRPPAALSPPGLADGGREDVLSPR